MPVYLPLAISVLVITYLIYYLFFKKSNDPSLNLLREKWGRRNLRERDFSLIGNFFRYKADWGNGYTVDDQTTRDLDLHEVFSVIDNTASKPGQQYLYYLLRCPATDKETLQHLDRWVKLFSEDEPGRISLQKELGRINKLKDYYIPNLLFEKPPSKPGWFKLTYLLQSSTLLVLLTGLYYPPVLPVVLLLLVINVFLHYKSKFKFASFYSALGRLNTLYQVSEKIIDKQAGIVPEIKTEGAVALKKCRKTVAQIDFLNTNNYLENEWLQIVWFLTELFKILTLREIQKTYSICANLEKRQADFLALFSIVGRLDAAISIASYRKSLPYYCHPEFQPDYTGYNFSEVYHPLVESCEPNNLQRGNQQSVFISGSNMSGKTTFIRTIALNALLARTIFTCLARNIRIPFCNIYSSIRITDDLQNNRSYYYQEIYLLREFIDHSQHSSSCNLFVIDEILKGTNSVERLKIARSILSYLAGKQNNLCLVSSHDLELAKEMSDQFAYYYFQEDIENEALIFDFKLRKGLLREGNAIKLLKTLEFPEEITNSLELLNSPQ